MTFARAKAMRAWLVRLSVVAAALALAAGPASARHAEATPSPTSTQAQAPAPDPAPAPAPAPKPVPKKQAPAAKSKPAPSHSSAPPSTSSPPPASPAPAPVSRSVPSAPKHVLAKPKAAAKPNARPKPKATPKKLPVHTVRAGTLGAARPGSASAPRATLAGSSPLVSNVGNPSRTWQTPLAILLFCIPMLLILAALVPLDVVPLSVVNVWQEQRTDVAFVGGAILLVEAVVYVLLA